MSTRMSARNSIPCCLCRSRTVWCENNTYLHLFKDLGRVPICDPGPLCGSVLVLSQASFTSFLGNSSADRPCSPGNAELPVSKCSGRRESVPAEAAGSVPGTRSQAAPRSRCDEIVPGRSQQGLRLAERPRHRQARHSYPLAPQRISPVLAVEVENTRTTEAPTSSDTDHGCRQSDLGRSANCG